MPNGVRNLPPRSFLTAGQGPKTQIKLHTDLTERFKGGTFSTQLPDDGRQPINDHTAER